LVFDIAGYTAATLLRTDFGHAHWSMRLRMAEAMATSACWAGSGISASARSTALARGGTQRQAAAST
jgi:hypothetical protein